MNTCVYLATAERTEIKNIPTKNCTPEHSWLLPKQKNQIMYGKETCQRSILMYLRLC